MNESNEIELQLNTLHDNYYYYYWNEFSISAAVKLFDAIHYSTYELTKLILTIIESYKIERVLVWLFHFISHSQFLCLPFHIYFNYILYDDLKIVFISVHVSEKRIIFERITFLFSYGQSCVSHNHHLFMYDVCMYVHDVRYFIKMCSLYMHFI